MRIMINMIFDMRGRFIENTQPFIVQLFKVFTKSRIHFKSIEHRILAHQMQQIIGNAAIARAKFDDAGSMREINIADDLFYQPR